MKVLLNTKSKIRFPRGHVGSALLSLFDDVFYERSQSFIIFYSNYRDDVISYQASTNLAIAKHPLYNVYLWVSETLLRLGPILTLTILNILIIVRYNRIARKREVLKGTAVHRTPTSKNGGGNNYRRSASPIMPIEGANGATTNGQFLTVANAQTTGENVSPTTLSVTQVSFILIHSFLACSYLFR